MPHDFQSDVNELASHLINAFGLTFSGEDSDVDDKVVRWLDFRLRHIDAQPRSILKSNGFDGRVPPEVQSALEGFITKACAGADLNPYQTKTVKRNDTSGTKRQLRTDGLWADWGIHHAHLTDAPLTSDAEFSERSDWLLFFLVLPDHLALIDIRSHAEKGIFQSIDLVEMAIRSWPALAEGLQIKGIVGLARSPSIDPGSVKALRKGGVSQMLEVDGRVYMPLGMGMTTAATSTRVSLEAMNLRTMARQLGNTMLQPESPIMKVAEGRSNVEPTLSLRILPDGRLAVCAQDLCIYVPFPEPAIPKDVRAGIEYLLAPSWARPVLAEKLGILGRMHRLVGSTLCRILLRLRTRL